MIYKIFVWIYFLFQFQQQIKQWAKPATLSLISGVLSDLTRSRSDLIVENDLLRQQLIVLHRQVKRPLLTQHDRFRLVLLARFTRFWKQALHIVQPDTLLRWHRDLFRFFWRMKSKRKQSKPKIPLETVDLIRIMAKENHLWGAERIRGELLKLGIKVCKRTIQKYLPKVRETPSSSKTWATFVKNMLVIFGLATLRWSMTGFSDRGISLSSRNSKLGGSRIAPLLHPRQMNGLHSN
jgi:putative transposase